MTFRHLYLLFSGRLGFIFKSNAMAGGPSTHSKDSATPIPFRLLVGGLRHIEWWQWQQRISSWYNRWAASAVTIPSDLIGDSSLSDGAPPKSTMCVWRSLHGYMIFFFSPFFNLTWNMRSQVGSASVCVCVCLHVFLYLLQSEYQITHSPRKVRTFLGRKSFLTWFGLKVKVKLLRLG